MNDASDTLGLVGRTLADKYAVERVVARGGFGTVYRAHHRTLGTPLALKVLRFPELLLPTGRAAFLARFELEARTTASLGHPAIVRVIDFGSSNLEGDETAWMALEWIEGRTLEDDLAARPAGVGRSPAAALALLRPAFDAIASAHGAGVAHRDLKPANLMIVAPRRGEASLRVLDFGIAKLMEGDEAPGRGDTLTATALPAFSPRYAAPEQLSHTRTGPWTDVHALGLILVELVTGRQAYGGDSVALHADALDRRRPTPARFGVDVGPWEDVLLRALALHPGDRYPSVDPFLAALDDALAEAEAAWQRDRLRTGVPASAETAPAVLRVPGLTKPSPASRLGVLALGVCALVVVGAGVAKAIRSQTRHEAVRAAPLRPSTPQARPASVVVAAPVVPVPPSLPAPTEVVDATPVVRRGRRPAARPVVAPVAAAPNVPPVAPSTPPVIVIE